MMDLFIKGGVLMYPIGFCSVVTVAIGLERFWALQRNRIIPSREVRDIETLVDSGKIMPALERCRASGSAYAQIVASVLQNVGERRGVIKEAVQEVGREEVVHMEQYLTFLGTIALIAPLLGLLGTVLGMIKVFTVISGQGVGDPAVLASGISEALMTTAAGLSVAIPSLILHRHFERRVDQFAVELEQSALRIVENIKSGN
ncbi:MAG: MotA/TolQ/ExbB proton channel family protein [Magnetococcales bacterium]|nr:MotA/TolQ/ExbB proton channel family protein [Magnetococcales bacterium]